MKKRNYIGIRVEDKYLMEKRVAITPEHLKKLNDENENLNFIVAPSKKRVFSDDEFMNAGAELNSDLSSCNTIFGVKEMPIDFFENEKTYVFFSHVIKGQDYNMPVLKEMMNKKINLIDYEKIADEEGKRLIFFGRYAGLAGMINSLWTLGLRLKSFGIDTPFLKIEQSHKYKSLDEAKTAVKAVGEEIRQNGLPKSLSPFVTGFTGYGNVSNGAQEIYDLLPVKEISVEEFMSDKFESNDNTILYKVVFKEKDLSKRVDGTEFELNDYYNNPKLYESKFEQYLPKLSLLMNCMYWTDEYPTIVTKEYLKNNYKTKDSKLIVIGDITCDINGSIECTEIGTLIEDPIFVYNHKENSFKSGYEGEGIQIMSVDILPSELPKDASETFSNALLPFVKNIVEADYDTTFENLKLPLEIKKALILHKGKLTASFKYLEEYLK